METLPRSGQVAVFFLSFFFSWNPKELYQEYKTEKEQKVRRSDNSIGVHRSARTHDCRRAPSDEEEFRSGDEPKTRPKMARNSEISRSWSTKIAASQTLNQLRDTMTA